MGVMDLFPVEFQFYQIPEVQQLFVVLLTV